MTGENEIGFDESIWSALEESLGNAIEKGLPIEKVPQVVSEALLIALDGTAPKVVETLIETMPAMLKEHRHSQLRFERRLRAFWGLALNFMYAVVVCAEESGRLFFGEHRERLGAAVEMLDALGGLHARACRTSLEIHRLLSGGFPLGALARCRTMHELSVTSAIIAEYGMTSEYKDLASRFLMHHHISNYKDAMQFQNASQGLGQEPFAEAEIESMLAIRNRLIGRFGRGYGEEHGWATPLFGRPPKFFELEKLAEVTHLRPYYKWASHEIHSDSKGLHLNVIERNGVSYMVTGPTLEGLADPGQIAMISLYQTTTNFLMGGLTDPSPKAMLALKSMSLLMDRAMKVLSNAESAVAGHVARRDRRQRRISVKRGPFRRTRLVTLQPQDAEPDQRDETSD